MRFLFRRRALVALLAFALIAVACAAARAAAVVPPAGTPDLSMMVLQPSDFSSTTVESEGYQKDPNYVASYERDFGPTATRSGTQYASAFSSVDLETDLVTASFDSALLYGLVHTKAFRRNLAKQIAKTSKSDLGVKVAPKNIAVGSPHALHVGQDSALLQISLRVKGQVLRLCVGFFRVNRAQAAFGLVAMPGHPVAISDAASVAALMAADMKLGLSPQVTSLPTIAGTPTQGLTLSVTPGTWLNSPGSYSYQWERCDTAGANCAPIAGQTGLTYTVTAADAGSTLRVSVIATNPVGSSKPAESVPTAVVH